MDPTGGSVPTGPNLTGEMEPGENKHLDRIYEKQICPYCRQEHLSSFKYALKYQDRVSK